MEPIDCPICHGEQEKIFQKKEGKHLVSVVICKDCGLVYLSPRMSKEDYANFYQTTYGQDSKYSGNVKDRARAEINAKQVLTRIKDFAPKRNFTRILEIGAGSGAIIDLLQEEFQPERVAVIEPSEQEASALKERGMNVIANDVDTSWEGVETFDLIILRHCLEHFLDPIRALQKVSASLTENGIVYIGVPDMMHPRKNRRLDIYWFRIVHTYYFTKETLTYLLGQVGLQPSIIKEESSELWCIVCKEAIQKITKPNLYRKQMQVIRKKRRSDTCKRFMKSPIATVRDLLKQSDY